MYNETSSINIMISRLQMLYTSMYLTVATLSSVDDNGVDKHIHRDAILTSTDTGVDILSLWMICAPFRRRVTTDDIPIR